MTLLEAIEHASVFADRHRRIAAVAVFLLAALSADRADASCGDWLAGHEPTPATPTAHDDQAPVPAAPCDGPSCRRSRQHLPILPPGPSRQLDNPERWLRPADELTARPPLFSSLPYDAEPTPPEGHRPSIDRPPRD